MNGITCSEHSFQDLETKKIMNVLDIVKVPSLCIVKVPQNMKEPWSSFLEKVINDDTIVLKSTYKAILEDAMDIVWKITNNDDGDF